MRPISFISAVVGHPRLRARLNWLVGLTLTLIVLTLMVSGSIEFLERITLDWRFRHFAYHNPAPSDRILHIDIDDNSLARTERWPWPRQRIALVVDELSRLGARMIAFDVLFTEPQNPRLVPLEDDAPTDADVDPTIVQRARRIEDDQCLADAVQRAGNVYMPIQFNVDHRIDLLADRVRKVLRDDVFLDADAVARELSLSGDETRRFSDHLASLKADVLRMQLIDRMDIDPSMSLAQCRAALMPDLAGYVTDAPELITLAAEYQRVRSIMLLRRDAPPVIGDDLFLPAGRLPDVPIPVLAAQVAGTGSVTYKADPDARVRSVPLWIRYQGRRYPHLTLRVACAYMGVPIDQVLIEDDHTILPDARLPSGETRTLRIPMLPDRRGAGGSGLTGRALVTWPTNAPRWDQLYAPEQSGSAQHFPIGPLIEINTLRADTADNETALDELIIGAANEYVSAKAAPYQQALAVLADPDASQAERDQARLDRDQLRADIIHQIGEYIKEGEATIDPSPEDLAFLSELQSIRDGSRDLANQITLGHAKIADFDRRIGAMVRDTICLVGWTSTGSIADFVPTSLDEKCPGVVVQGAVLHAMLTDHFIGRGPLWADMLLALAVGLLTTAITSRFNPVSGMFIVGLFIAAMTIANGLLLFDYFNLWIAVAGPGMAGVFVWAGITVFRLIIEQRERARITKRFKNYVSPDLVDYLIQNPDVVNLEGQRRELTCMFSDIASFTSISEKLGPEQTIKLLNHYLATMTEKLMLSRAYVNKYLGDGIMAFWGAPIENKQNALDACDSALACIDALNGLNRNPQFESLPPLYMRVGLCTGPMMVGDCGAPPQRSDYTVIGDSVNLASRLEGANKQFGTQILVSDNTKAQVDDQMLTRMVGHLVVVGRTEAEPVHELMVNRENATDEQTQLAQDTTDAVKCYIAGGFERCAELFTDLSARFGTSKLADVYLDACRRLIADPPHDFDGSLVLSEK